MESITQVFAFFILIISLPFLGLWGWLLISTLLTFMRM